MSALLQRIYRDDLMKAYLAFDLLLIIEMLVLIIKKTGTACIAMPAQTNVFIIFILRLVTAIRQILFPINKTR